MIDTINSPTTTPPAPPPSLDLEIRIGGRTVNLTNRDRHLFARRLPPPEAPPLAELVANIRAGVAKLAATGTPIPKRIDFSARTCMESVSSMIDQALRDKELAKKCEENRTRLAKESATREVSLQEQRAVEERKKNECQLFELARKLGIKTEATEPKA